MKSAWLNTKTIFLTGIAGVSVLAFFGQLHFPDSSRNFLGDTKRAELSTNGPITQVFRANQNHLEGFQIFMGDTDLGFGERIDFALLDATCETTLSRSSRSMFSLPTTRATHFTFPTLPASMDETYCLSIQYHPGFMKKKERPYIRVTEDEQFKDVSYTDHGKEKTYPGRTLQIKPLYAPTEGSFARIGELENRLSQYKPAFAKGSMLALGIAGIFLAIVFFIWIARRED